MLLALSKPQSCPCVSFWTLLLLQETMHRAKMSKQPSIFLKLDFSKAYDIVLWRFLVHTMRAMNINEKFTGWVKMFSENASTTINPNSKHIHGNKFRIERAARQGCLLCPLSNFYF